MFFDLNAKKYQTSIQNHFFIVFFMNFKKMQNNINGYYISYSSKKSLTW